MPFTVHCGTVNGIFLYFICYFYIRSGTSIPSSPIASFTTLPTLWLNAEVMIELVVFFH